MLTIFCQFEILLAGEAQKPEEKFQVEALKLLQELIRKKPFMQNEKEVAEVIKSYLTEKGVESQLKVFDLNRANILAIHKGTNPKLKPIVLFGHLDVVPADKKLWKKDYEPFSAEIKNGDLIGRGTVDMLNMVALQAVSLAYLKEKSIQTRRDIVFLSVADEEIKTTLGIKLALKDWPWLKKAAVVLNEGGYILKDYFKKGQDIAAVCVADKGQLQFEIQAKGQSGHGSTPIVDSANLHLVKSLNSYFVEREKQFTLNKENTEMLKALGKIKGGLEGFLMGYPKVLTTIFRSKILKKPSLAAILQNSCTLTGLKSGYAVNVIPENASATVDCRLLPGTDPKKFQKGFEGFLSKKERLSIKIIHRSPATSSGIEGKFLKRILSHFDRPSKGLYSGLIMGKATTDCRFFREEGVPCYGIIPMAVNKEEIAGAHGLNERISVKEFKKGLGRLINLVLELDKVN